MSGFYDAVARYDFMRWALAAGLLASIACGIVGSYVVARRITYIAGGISHCVLGGMGLARYLAVVHGVAWLTPLHGALAAALGSALVIGWVSLRARQREDTVIGALWAIGMAVGILFIARTPGYNEDLMSYLFGNILMVSRSNLFLIAGLDLFVMGSVLFCYNAFLAVTFDEEFARVRGIRVELYYLFLLGLTALTVVLLVMVVGIVMVIALLTLPSAIAGQFARNLRQMMAGAVILSAAFTSGGLALSYGRDWPSGATIVLLAAIFYVTVTLGKGLYKARRNSKIMRVKQS